MRIVAIADTHTFETDLGRLPDGDVLVHAGDLCRAGSLDEMTGTIRWLRDHPHPYKLLVAGNHDWCFVHQRNAALELLGPDIVYLEDAGIDLAGVRFWGSPWQPAFNDWAFNLPRGEALAEKWAQIPIDTDVLITHGPPRGFGDTTTVGGRHGCDDLLTAVRRIQPRLHLFGHIHEDGGLWTDGEITFVNVTTWECERAATVIDLTRDSVIPIQIPPER